MKTAVHHDELSAEIGWVRALARRLLQDAARADDAAQEAIARALTVPARVPRRGPTLRAFLATATRIVARDQRRADRRRGHRERQVARPEATSSTFDQVARGIRAKALIAAVDALDEPYRATVRLRYLEQLSTREVAARTGTRPVTVRKRLSRGLAMLRARLESEWGDSSGSWATWVLPLAGTEGARRGLVPAAARAAAVLGALGGAWVVAERMTPAVVEASPAAQPTQLEVGAAVDARLAPLLRTTPDGVLDEGAASEPMRSAASSPALAARDEPLEQDHTALLGAAFTALHAVSQAGEAACAGALERTLDCSSCHAGADPSPAAGPADGPVLLRFADGMPRAEGRVVHGARHGPWTEWHPGGEVAARGEYFDGDRHGWWTFWSTDGEQRVAEGEFLYGQREGDWIEFGPEETRAASASWRRGLRHGVERVWHPGGSELASVVSWHAGQLDGLARTWHANGQLASEGRYERGRAVGIWRYWDAQGRLEPAPPSPASG